MFLIHRHHLIVADVREEPHVLVEPQALEPLRHGRHARVLREVVRPEVVESRLAAGRAVHHQRPDLMAVLARQRETSRFLNELFIAQVFRRRRHKVTRRRRQTIRPLRLGLRDRRIKIQLFSLIAYIYIPPVLRKRLLQKLRVVIHGVDHAPELHVLADSSSKGVPVGPDVF